MTSEQLRAKGGEKHSGVVWMAGEHGKHGKSDVFYNSNVIRWTLLVT